jgi:hypothetical protein
VGKKILQPMEGVMALLEKRYKLSRAKKEITSLREEMGSMNGMLLKLAARTQLDEQQRDWRES